MFGLFVVVAASLTLVGFFIWIFLIPMIGDIRRKKLLSEAIQKLKDSGIVFYWNQEHSVTAVCTWLSFHSALVEHEEKIRNGEAQEWDKVVLYAKPTYTFASNPQTRRPIHTGILEDFEKIVEEIVESVTSLKHENFSYCQYKKLAQTITKKDTRLFVPYCGKVAGREWQFLTYGRVTLDHAREVLLGK